MVLWHGPNHFLCHFLMVWGHRWSLHFCDVGLCACSMIGCSCLVLIENKCEVIQGELVTADLVSLCVHTSLADRPLFLILLFRLAVARANVRGVIAPLVGERRSSSAACSPIASSATGFFFVFYDDVLMVESRWAGSLMTSIMPGAGSVCIESCVCRRGNGCCLIVGAKHLWDHSVSHS